LNVNALNALKPGDKRRLFEQKRRALQDELKQQDWEGPVDHQEPYADYQEEEEEANYQATGYQTNASPDETMSYQRYHINGIRRPIKKQHQLTTCKGASRLLHRETLTVIQHPEVALFFQHPRGRMRTLVT
jgi:hypothetical protein